MSFLTSKTWMRACACALVVACGRPAWGEDIASVLQRSQSAHLASLPTAEAESERAIIVRRSFDVLVKRLETKGLLEIRIVTGAVVAECLLGHVVVANESLAGLQEPVRLFLLAHEVGHALLGHWEQMARLYSRYMPGEIGLVKVHASTSSSEFLTEVSLLSRAHEFEADAFAYEMLRRLGYRFADVVGALTAFGMQRDTATHPGTGKRIAHLRSLG